MKHSTKNCALVIKNLSAMKNLINQNLYNFTWLKDAYDNRDDEDVEYTTISVLLNNFILSASIVKQYISSFANILDEDFLHSKSYIETRDFLLKDNTYMLLIGLRNYLQHVFELKLCFGNISDDTDDEELFIVSFTMLYNECLDKRHPENVALCDFFSKSMGLPIMPFTTDVMGLLVDFYDKYKNCINDYFKNDFAEYDNLDPNQYALDMHCIYFENMQSMHDNNID